ncbi:MAG: hypothetical protein LBR38_05420 [Synergistaceae bacterium]|jgi:hypothetical protein|nr:hypothetical protein [Synergistaceae bacterium]
MADARDDGLRAAADEAPQQPVVNVVKKKRGKGSLLFAIFLLAVGAATGLHFSGLWDARPLLWTITPNIPYVGDTLAEFFRVPKEFTLTAAERREMELREWEDRLAKREAELGRDAGEKAQDEQPAPSAPTPKPEPPNTDSREEQLMNQVVRTYQDMSARSAAQIVEELSDSLAVKLVQKLPNDVRASILGKMTPKKAARITELMASGR